MRKLFYLKALMLSLCMAVSFVLPLNAQKSDDFFKVGDEFNGNRDVVAWTITNNGIGQSEAPLGSGLLILGAASAGYFIAKRRKNKKGATLLLVLVMMLGMTQCKKNIETISDVATNGVDITLNVDGGEKVVVNPTGGSGYATVTWASGDILYVGNNGAYCGYLKYDGTKFGGTITPTSGDDGDYLHFYFMGNMGEESEPTSVSISDQRSSYPVISYGRSTTLFNSGTTEYSATLYNKCAIVKFTTNNIDKDITIKGMYNTVTVDFSKNNGTGDPVNPYTYSKTGPGYITLHRESNTERWAILLPQGQVTTAKAYAPGYATASDFTVPAIEANTYHNTPIEVNLAAGDVFSVSNSQAVHFSPGNLQYKDSDGTWRFAEHQWDVPDKQGNNQWTSSEWVSLFGWGAWGDGNNPRNTSSTDSQYTWKDFSVDLDGHSDWYTLTSGQWTYLINTREGVRYLHGTITVSDNNYVGLIIFPDGYMGYGVIGDYTYNNAVRVSVSADDWSSMETAGAIFLPAAGWRNGNTANYKNSSGYYWSKTNSGSNYAYNVLFNSEPKVVPASNTVKRWGYSVRLVRN